MKNFFQLFSVVLEWINFNQIKWIEEEEEVVRTSPVSRRRGNNIVSHFLLLLTLYSANFLIQLHTTRKL